MMSAALPGLWGGVWGGVKGKEATGSSSAFRFGLGPPSPFPLAYITSEHNYKMFLFIPHLLLVCGLHPAVLRT